MIVNFQRTTVLKFISEVLISLIGSLLLAAIIFSIGSLLFGNSFTGKNLLSTFWTALVFAPVFGGVQSFCAIAVSLIARKSGSLNSWFTAIVASIVTLIVGLVMFHETLGRPSVDLAWSLFNTFPLFVAWNLALGFGCWVALQFANRFVK